MLKGYEEYKDTGYDWIPLVPKTWKQRTIRSITSLSNERNGKRKDLELLSVYREFGVIKKSSRDDNHNVESQDLSNYKYVNSCYLVMNKMKMWQGSLGISQHEGIVSPAYIVCKVDQNIIGKYLHYLLRSSQFKTFYNRISYGVRVGQWDLRYNDLKNLKIYLPTSDEQNQIVRYLDAKIAKINRLISAKKKEIALLKEYKQAIITRAVTKGIRAGVPMKESGVEWIGEIPEGWGVSPLKYTTTCNNQVLSEQTDEDTQINYIDIGSVNSDGNILNVQNLSFKEAPSRARRIVSENDTIISTVRTYLKAIAFIPKSYDNFIVSTGFAVLTPQKQYNPRYFYYALRVDWFISLIESNSVGISYPAINSEKLISLPNIVPPLPEQQEIADYLDAKCSAIDATIQKRELAIEKLTEYKLSLIYECVTGKVDVRGIHVEEVPEAELIEEFDEEIVDEFDDETSEEEIIE